MSTHHTITVLGLGTVGSQLSADLVAAGAEVIAFDPMVDVAPAGVQLVETPAEAVAESDLVIAATAPSQAPAALAQVIAHLGEGSVYADVSTGSPKLKRGLALTAAASGIDFVGVAILSIRSGVGLGAPMLASGAGVDAFVSAMADLGATIEAAGEDPGTAASRKMLRAIVIRGISALVAESLAAATEAGDAEWLWDNLSAELETADEGWLERLFDTFGPYAENRRGEAEVLPLYLADLSVAPVMTEALVELTRAIATKGLPRRP